MARHSLIVGLYSPCSMALIVCLDTPTASASAFCVMSFSARATLIAIFLAKYFSSLLCFYIALHCRLLAFLIKSIICRSKCQVYITFVSLYFTCKGRLHTISMTLLSSTLHVLSPTTPARESAIHSPHTRQAVFRSEKPCRFPSQKTSS